MSRTERLNPDYTEAARKDALAGTPLMGTEGFLQPSPPRTLRLSESQLDAWHQVRGKIQDVHLLILSVLTRCGEGCIRSVHDETGIETSTISARMHDLKRMGLIEPIMLPNGKQKRMHYTVRGKNSSGDAWQAREDWKQFIKNVQGYPGILL
jgi:DNA-binding MarR family transcriptional regulator